MANDNHSSMLGCTPAVKCMLACGANANSELKCWFDSDPMGWASSFGHLPSLIALIRAGGNPFLANKSGNNALSDARRERHLHIVKFLSEFEKKQRPEIPQIVKQSEDIREWLLKQRRERANGGYFLVIHQYCLVVFYLVKS